MTLCMVWRTEDDVHFCSDSRVMVSGDSYADVAIKVLALPVNIYSPRNSSGVRSLDYAGEIGMCFAGSVLSSLFLKEAIAELLKGLQYAPGHTDISMDGLARFIFNAYKNISTNICQTAIGPRGIACIVVSGMCPLANTLRTYILKTNEQNNHSCKEILTEPGQYGVIGSGKRRARSLLPERPKSRDFLEALKAVADDEEVPSVGGAVQYGHFQGQKFKCCGIIEFDGTVRYWRGGLDVNGEGFIGGYGNFVPEFSFIHLRDAQ